MTAKANVDRLLSPELEKPEEGKRIGPAMAALAGGLGVSPNKRFEQFSHSGKAPFQLVYIEQKKYQVWELKVQLRK